MSTIALLVALAVTVAACAVPWWMLADGFSGRRVNRGVPVILGLLGVAVLCLIVAGATS